MAEFFCYPYLPYFKAEKYLFLPFYLHVKVDGGSASLSSCDFSLE